VNRVRWLVFGALAVGLLLVYLVKPAPNEQFASLALTRGWTSDTFSGVTAECLDLLLVGTQFEGRWQINKPLSREKINVLLLKGDAASRRGVPAGFTRFLGGCFYAGKPNLIVCDEAFLTRFPAQYGILEIPNGIRVDAARQEAINKRRREFLLWVLGHELGHLLHGHAPAHFSGPTSPANLDTVVASSTLSQRQEFEADAAFVTALHRRPQLQVGVETMLLDLLNFEISRKVQHLPYGAGVLFDYNNQEIVRYARQGTHPEFVVRSTRMLQLSLDRPEGKAMKYLVDQFARQMREQ